MKPLLIAFIALSLPVQILTGIPCNAETMAEPNPQSESNTNLFFQDKPPGRLN